MGFKRTSEGRVFFENSGGTANDHLDRTDKTQTQIITLLKALNERLKMTQSERSRMRTEIENYRAMIESLEQRAARSEKAYLDLEQKISGRDRDFGGSAKRAEKLAKEAFKEMEEARKALFELEEKSEFADKHVLDLKSQIGQTRKISEEITRKQAALEKMQRDQNQKLVQSTNSYVALTKRVQEADQRFEDMNARIEESQAQQTRIIRKIDKAVEDRARFMRKIERIEETVTQTRDALNARAMVLLTDQEAAARAPAGTSQPVALEQNIAQKETAAHSEVSEGQTGEEGFDISSLWRKPVRIELVGVVLLVIAGVLSGWLISSLQQPSASHIAAITGAGQTAAEIPDDVWEIMPAGSGKKADTLKMPSSYEEGALNVSPSETAPGITGGIDAISRGAPDVTALQASEKAVNDDLGTVDLNNQEQLLAILEKNPRRVGEELNKIEPATPNTAPITEAVKTAKSAVPPVKKVNTPSPEKSKPTERLSVKQPRPKDIKPVPKALANKDLRGAMERDPALPEVIQVVEQKAFEGVAEAQHDLAAIYTAGHGGVKQDYERALFWFRQAAERGVANARYNLGVLYHQGLGTIQNIDEAIRWYQAAADLGHPEAQYNLGIAYIESIGVQYDPQKAAENFRSAADNGIMEAAYNLGLIYENGLLGEAQPDMALKWYKAAADKGSPEAQAALRQLAETLGIGLDDVNRVVEGMKVLRKGEADSSLEKQVKAEQMALTMSKTVQESDLSVEQMLVSDVQRYLMRVGLYPGPADGVNGPLTRDAVRSYQALYNMSVNGEVSAGLLEHMIQNKTFRTGDAGTTRRLN